MSNDSTRPYDSWDDEQRPRSNGQYRGGENDQYGEYGEYGEYDGYGDPRQRPPRPPRSRGQQPPRNPQNPQTTRRLPPQEPSPRSRPNTGSQQSSTGRPRPTNDFRQSSPRDAREYDEYDDETYIQPRSYRTTDVPRRDRYPETEGRRAQRARYSDAPTRQARPRTSTPTGQRRPRRQRRTWPWLLTGCFGGILLVIIGVLVAVFLAIHNTTGGGINIGGIGGIGGIGNSSAYTQRRQLPVPMLSIEQLQIHNQIGDVTITVDPNTTTPLVTTTKSVKATSQSDANKQFGGINVQIEPAGTAPTTLAVSASVSDNSTIFSTHNSSVSIVISLPQSVNGGSAPVVLNGGSATSNITSVGNVTLNGLNGVLNVKNDIGNITVQNATLSPGSTLETGTGNVTFNGSMNTSAGSSSNQSIYTLQSESGNLNVTLPASINVTLDAYTNSGNITSDFDVSRIKLADGSLEGPIIYGTTPNALLKLHVSTGNVALHKGA